MAEKKITKKDRFNEIIALARANGKDEIVEFCEHELELLARKNSTKADGKPTKAQQARIDLAGDLYDWLTEQTEGKTCTEMLKECPALAEIEDCSTSKVTSLLTYLKDEGRVTNEKIKGKSYYKAVVDEDEG